MHVNAALLIGVDCDGNACANNVLRMSAMLRSVFGYRDDRVLMMCDDNHRNSMPPTRTNVELGMLKLIEWSKEGVHAGDVVTLWIYGCFSQDLGDDGVLCLHGDPADPVLTRDQFWRFLGLLHHTTRVVCMIDGPTCAGVAQGTFRYSGRRTLCCSRPISVNTNVPDLLFIFGDTSANVLRRSYAPPPAAATRGRAASPDSGGDDDDEDEGYLSDGGPIMFAEQHRVTSVFIDALQQYNRRLSITTLLRKMAALARKARRDFVPVIETTRPLDPVRPFSVTESDMPIMIVRNSEAGQ